MLIRSIQKKKLYIYIYIVALHLLELLTMNKCRLLKSTSTIGRLFISGGVWQNNIYDETTPVWHIMIQLWVWIDGKRNAWYGGNTIYISNNYLIALLTTAENNKGREAISLTYCGEVHYYFDLPHIFPSSEIIIFLPQGGCMASASWKAS